MLARRSRDAARARRSTAVLDAFERRVTPVWPSLRAQVVHTDLTVDNALTDDAGLITGIVDFGDMSHTALIADLASVLDSLGGGREADELFRVARLVLDGYQRRVPLEDARARGARRSCGRRRSAITIAISSWRVAQGLEEPGVRRALQRRRPARCIETLEAVGWDERARRLGAAGRWRPTRPSPRGRRGARSARRSIRCSTPSRSRSRSAEGVWITDTDGPPLPRRLQQRAVRRPRPPAGHDGDRPPEPPHQHPHALPAPSRDRARRAADRDVPARARHRAVRQLRLRGQRPRLADGDAPSPGGGGGLCTDFAYHGITEAIAALSPEGWLGGAGARRTSRRGSRPTPTAGGISTRRRSRRRSQRLDDRGLAPAAAILDGAAHQRRHRRPRPRLRPGPRPADARGRRRCGSPTRCRPATAAPATRCGASSASASSRTSSRSASRWATATRSPP